MIFFGHSIWYIAGLFAFFGSGSFVGGVLGIILCILWDEEGAPGFLNRWLQHKVIVNCDRDPYLFRWYVFRTKRVALFIHRFVRSDEDRALHDHPWGFLVIPIWRGYIEHSEGACSICLERFPTGHTCPQWLHKRFVVKRRVWPIIGTRLRPATYRHRVELIDGKSSWSIFFRFKEVRTWGFWLPDGFVAWNKWWADKCE